MCFPTTDATPLFRPYMPFSICRNTMADTGKQKRAHLLFIKSYDSFSLSHVKENWKWKLGALEFSIRGNLPFRSPFSTLLISSKIKLFTTRNIFSWLNILKRFSILSQKSLIFMGQIVILGFVDLLEPDFFHDMFLYFEPDRPLSEMKVWKHVIWIVIWNFFVLVFLLGSFFLEPPILRHHRMGFYLQGQFLFC